MEPALPLRRGFVKSCFSVARGVAIAAVCLLVLRNLQMQQKSLLMQQETFSHSSSWLETSWWDWERSRLSEPKVPRADSLIHRQLLNRSVSFLTAKSMSTTVQPVGHYSGMWWMPRDAFVNKLQAYRIQNLEGGSWQAFAAVGMDSVILTFDWLDFCVEHLSRYFKMINYNKFNHVFAKLVDLHKSYMTSELGEDASGRFDVQDTGTAMRETIALFPLYIPSEPVLLTGISRPEYNTSLLYTIPAGAARRNALDMYSMAATLLSLWRVGVGRVVVAGNMACGEDDTDVNSVYHEALDLFLSSIPSSGRDAMEINYVCAVDDFDRQEAKNTSKSLLMPRLVIDKLQRAFRGNLTTTQNHAWLGDDSNRWKYVYFSEPDLILHTRPHAVRELGVQLEQGKLIAAHRFQPISHAVDFPNYPRSQDLIPADADDPATTAFINLDPSAGDSCCDAGNYWPGRTEHKKCSYMWLYCGYLANDADPDVNQSVSWKRHERLWRYFPLVSFTSGFRSPMVSEHARICRPQPASAGGCMHA
jgi:hypothetical protein